MAGVAKGYNLSFEYVLNELSYANLMLYSAVIPSHDDEKEEEEENEEIVNADDPKNAERVKKLMFAANE